MAIGSSPSRAMNLSYRIGQLLAEVEPAEESDCVLPYKLLSLFDTTPAFQYGPLRAQGIRHKSRQDCSKLKKHPCNVTSTKGILMF